MTRMISTAAHRAGHSVKHAAQRYVEFMAYADPAGVGLFPLDSQPISGLPARPGTSGQPR